MGKKKGKKQSKGNRPQKHGKGNRKQPDEKAFQALKILYRADLALVTALHMGCRNMSPVGAFDMMKNGAGEYIIPGTAVAGVFIDTLRHLLSDKEKKENAGLYAEICTETTNGDDENRTLNGSRLIFRTVNLGLPRDLPLKIRNRVRIDRKTKTAQDKNLFSYWEIEPEGTTFRVEIEIDNLSLRWDAGALCILSGWVETVLASWAKDGVFFGAHNSSGNGYCTLIPVGKTEPDTSGKPNGSCFKKMEINSEAAFRAYLDDCVPPSVWDNRDRYLRVPDRYKTWTIEVNVEDEEDGFGTNALLIRGGVSHNSLGLNPSDAVFINTGSRLFIPGSSLKGAFSMFLEKYGKTAWLQDILGQDQVEHQGYLYFPDLFFRPDVGKNNTRHLIHIERHAEDEFTRAVFGSGKFSEERLFHAKTKGKLRMPVYFWEKNKRNIQKLMSFLQQGCGLRLISLGANGCYPDITITEDGK